MLMRTSLFLLLAGTALAVPAAQPAARATPPTGCDASCLTSALACLDLTSSGTTTTTPVTVFTSCLEAACPSADLPSILDCLDLSGLPGLPSLTGLPGV
ncbi:hypothetical protein PsYK624_151220 [Phanerochaete sordida]|uniref:Extracellular membrane protein CFEM domain-containing protein n=1 Tax=Phanerochaete sordida TaxID=48140 RepID=A0A9P3GNS6_9APHY|nr:hypothetical protein PsYK624_151220 [Phanerochaete sordida]